MITFIYIRKGDALISDKVPLVLDQLRKRGKKIYFVTNNSTKSRKGYLKKFLSLGLTISPDGKLFMVVIIQFDFEFFQRFFHQVMLLQFTF